MTNFHGFTKDGRDYTAPLRCVLPEVIGTQPKTLRQIAHETGRDYESARRAIIRAKKLSPSPVMIAGWSKESSMCPAAMYLWKTGDDAPRPKALTSTEKSRIYYQDEARRLKAIEASNRWKKSEAAAEYHVRRNQKVKTKRAARSRAKELLKPLDPLLAAIMG